MSNKQARKKRSASSSKRKRITLPHQPTNETEEEIIVEEDIELDHTPKKVKSDVTLSEIETPKETEEEPPAVVVKVITSDDSDDDLLNDNSFAQFCDPTNVKKTAELNMLDYEYEKKLIEQHSREFDECIRVKKINDELNRLIKEEIDKSNTRIDLNSLTREEKKDHLKKLMEGTDNEIELSMLDHITNEVTYDKYYKDLRMQLFCEEISRFNIFSLSKDYLHIRWINDQSQFIGEFLQFSEPRHEFCFERYKLFTNSAEYSLKEIGAEDILDDVGLSCLQSTKKPNHPFLAVEEAAIVLQLLDQKKSRRLQILIRKTVENFVNGEEIDISGQDLACLAIHFLISQYFNFGNYIGKPHKSLEPYSIYSTLSKTKLINTTELSFILNNLDGDYSTLIRDLFNIFDFNIKDTLQDDIELELKLNDIIQQFFPPTFSKFLISKPFYNTSKSIITFYKKFFACMLINLTGMSEITHEEIFSIDYEFNNTTNRKLVATVIEILEPILEQCKGKSEIQFPLLHLIKNILSIFDICADLARDSSFVRDELLKLSASLKPHFRYADFSFLKLQFPYLDASFMQNLTENEDID